MSDQPHPAAPRRSAKDRLFARLDECGIAHTTARHAPVFTVEESRHLRGEIPGCHCKSLFLKSKSGKLYLVVAAEDQPVALNKLAKHLKAGRLSFAAADRLRDILGVTPGSVTPFALINDADRTVHVILDKHMLEQEIVNYHPLENDATTSIAARDLVKFVAACGHDYRIVDFKALNDG